MEPSYQKISDQLDEWTKETFGESFAFRQYQKEVAIGVILTFLTVFYLLIMIRPDIFYVLIYHLQNNIHVILNNIYHGGEILSVKRIIFAL